MAPYEFLTTWCLDAPIGPVFDLLSDVGGYPRWWKGVLSVQLLAGGDAGGLAARHRLTWRSALPYSLTFDLEVTRVQRPHLIEGRATGELDGFGTWRLYEGSEGVAVVYDWRVHTTKRWMNALGPLLRPAFVYNHDLVMRQGGVGLASELGATLLAQD